MIFDDIVYYFSGSTNDFSVLLLLLLQPGNDMFAIALCQNIYLLLVLCCFASSFSQICHVEHSVLSCKEIDK